MKPVWTEVGIHSLDEVSVIVIVIVIVIGAIEGESWPKITKHEKGRLLTELEGYHELEALFQAEGVQLTPP